MDKGIPRHFVVRKGQLLPQDHLNQINNMNFRNIPYVHNVRMLNLNHSQQEIQKLRNKIQDLQNKIIQIISNNTAEKSILQSENQRLTNIIILKNQQIIQLNKQIQRLSKIQQTHQKQCQKSKLSASVLINNFFNKDQNLSSSKVSFDSSNVVFENQKDSRIAEQLLKRVQNSQNILDEMLKMIKKPTQKTKQIRKQINNQQNQFHRRKASHNQQFEQTFIMNSKQQFLQHCASCQFDDFKMNYQQFECQSQLKQSAIYEDKLNDSKVLQYEKQNSLQQRLSDVNQFQKDPSIKKAKKKTNSRLATQISNNNE